MIKNYTEPRNRAIWARYAPILRVLFICSVLGSSFSGISEYYNFYKSFDIPLAPARMAAALSLTLLIEFATRAFSRLFFESIFEPAELDEEEQNKLESGEDMITREHGRIPILVLSAIAIAALVYVSTTNSLEGKREYVNDTTEAPDSVQVDDSRARVLESQAYAQFRSDSLAVVAQVANRIRKERNQLSAVEEKAQKNIDWLKKTNQYSYTRAKPYINRRDDARDAIKSLSQKQEEEVSILLLPYRSTLAEGIAQAASVRNGAMVVADSASRALQAGFAERLSRKQSNFSYAVYLSIIFILLYNFLKYYAYKASGRKPFYIVNPIGSSTSPIGKFKEGLKVKAWNILNRLADKAVGNEIEVDDTSLTIKKKEQPKKQKPSPLEGLDLSGLSGSPLSSLSANATSKDKPKQRGNPQPPPPPTKKESKPPKSESGDTSTETASSPIQPKPIQPIQPRKRPADIILKSVSDTSPLSVSDTDLAAQAFDGQDDTIRKSFLDNVRNHYKAYKGLGARGKTIQTRFKNEKLYRAEKDFLTRVGVEVEETDKTVRFKIKAIDTSKLDL